MSNSWAGSVSQATNTAWEITGTVSIGRTLTLAGGNIAMDICCTNERIYFCLWVYMNFIVGFKIINNFLTFLE
ncbi:MAG: hypothetical protein LBV72_15450 [Tannerella sp.]|jgi:hypothetical protein|nr:hypothetical protein [Tannerella sp.]